MDGGRGDGSDMGFQHLVSEASENHVAVVGRHDLRSPHPDVPSHLIEITKVDLDVESEANGNEGDRVEEPRSERNAHSVLVNQFLAD